MHSPNWTTLPAGLPVPTVVAAAHLTGTRLPSIALFATTGATVDLSAQRLSSSLTPPTGKPGKAPPTPDWDMIPGARGCTPQHRNCLCSKRFFRHRSLVYLFLYNNPKVREDLVAVRPCGVVVRNDGKISLPLLKDIEAVGNTPSQLFGNCANRHKRRLQPRRSPIKDFDIDNITEQSALPASNDSNSGQGARRP